MNPHAAALQAHAERTRAEIDWAMNPHEFRVEALTAVFVIVNRLGEWVSGPKQFYATYEEAEAAICEMICDDEADRKLNRRRHEQGADR